MEAGRNEDKDDQGVRGLADSLSFLCPEEIDSYKLTQLRQMAEGLEKAIEEIKEGKTEEIGALLQEQEILMRSIDALDHSIPSVSDQPHDGIPPHLALTDMQKKELSRIIDLHRELTALVRCSMEEAKGALVDIKKQKELRDIKQRMDMPPSGSLMDHRYR